LPKKKVLVGVSICKLAVNGLESIKFSIAVIIMKLCSVNTLFYKNV